MNLDKRGAILAASALFVVALIASGVNQGSSGEAVQTANSTWQQVELEDVNSGQSFTVAELDKPVLIETFAVWCTTCTRQQQEIKKLHEQSGVTSVSLNVDVNEDGEKIRQHTQRQGFDWRYAVSPPELTRSLVEQYGNSIRHPPSAPVVLVCENSTRRLPNGVKPVSKLQEEIERGC